MDATASILEQFYAKYNHREFVHPDPVEFLYAYDDLRDREIVAYISSSLAYGRVTQILKSISTVLKRMPSPASFIAKATRKNLEHTFSDFKHRFTTGEDLAGMLFAIKRLHENYGSLGRCFAKGLQKGDTTVFPALCLFAGKLLLASGDGSNSLITVPEKGSACKRLNLFLRWLVRRDAVDPGGWNGVGTSGLIVPLDTHMHRMCRMLGLTKRRQADMRTAVEITQGFARYAPEDPVRYDFALTRPGIRKDLNTGDRILSGL